MKKREIPFMDYAGQREQSGALLLQRRYRASCERTLVRVWHQDEKDAEPGKVALPDLWQGL